MRASIVTRRLVASLLLVLSGAVAAGAAGSDPRPPGPATAVRVDPEINGLVADLDDPSYAKREAATAGLLKCPFDRDQFLAVLARDSLSAEQQHRLVAIVCDRLINRPRGAVGISMHFDQADATQPGEVVVLDLLPNLPAERVLQIGDRITHVDGEPLRRRDDLVRRVQLRPPGERLRLSVKRPLLDGDGFPVLDESLRPRYEKLEVDVVLGSADMLRNRDGRLEKSSVLEDLRRDALAVAKEYGQQPRQVVIRD